jgi:hypothetical protein
MHATLQDHYDAHIEAKAERRAAQTAKIGRVKETLNVKKRVQTKLAQRKERKEKERASGGASAHAQNIAGKFKFGQNDARAPQANK